mgnify:CR=1 FL=1
MVKRNFGKIMVGTGIALCLALGFSSCLFDLDSCPSGHGKTKVSSSASSESACAKLAIAQYGSNAYYCYYSSTGACYAYSSNPN